MCFPPNLVIGNGVGECAGCLNDGMIPKACILYFAGIQLVRYIHTHIPVYISMHDQCLGEERIFLFDLSKAIMFCKMLF